MQAYVGVIALCTVSGIISCIIHEICNKLNDKLKNKLGNKDRSNPVMDKSYISHIIKTTVFYILMFHTILSLFKTVLGNGAMTLIESFDEVSWRTYLHYSIPLIVISIAAPFILKILLREKTDNFVLLALSLIIGSYSIIYLIFAEINNLWCVCFAAAGLILALLIVYFYKGKISCCTLKTWKKRLKLIVPIILFWDILMMLLLPNQLYLGNANEIGVPYGIFVRTLLIGALWYFVIFTAVSVYFLTSKQFILMCEAVFGISLLCLVQAMILNGKMDVMDGSMQTWPILTKVVNAVIWIAVIAVIIALKYIIKKNPVQVYSQICIYLALIQLVTWGYIRITSGVEKAEKDFEFTTEARFEMDSEHNVVVFVLDWFDGQILDRVIADDEDILEPLKDFTWYRNMTSAYAFTTMSVPYMLTGVEWQYDMVETDYSDYALKNGTMLKDIAAKNYDIGLYTSRKYMSDAINGVARNYSDVTLEGWNYSGIVKQMLECSKYKSYPFALKNKYWYADGDISRAIRDTSVHDVAYDEPFYADLLNNGIKVRTSDKYDGAFRFYHLHGMHTPFEPDMISQGEYCLNIVYEYLEQLKDAGLYDEATIIITADHGQNYITMEDKLDLYDFDMASSPILFVKKSGQTNETGPEISMAPVAHSEMQASIIEAVYGDTLEYGDTFADIPEDAQRERYFVFRRHDDIPYAKYAINGYAREWSNWTQIE